jgi:hypothetical protein
MARNPNWWKDEHTSAWERTRAAFRRDWEQTKADLTGRSRGHDLNQDAGDTFRQLSGKQPIPPGNFPNAPDADDMGRHAKHLDRQHERVARAEQRVAQADDPERAARLAHKAEEVRHEAHYAERMYEVNRSLRWEDVEEPARFGFGAGMAFDASWDDHQDELRRSWAKHAPDRPYDEVRDHVRLGFDRARNRAW